MAGTILSKSRDLSTEGHLDARDPANPNAPGLQKNKNGPPGPQGNQKGPSRDKVSDIPTQSPVGEAPSTETTTQSAADINLPPPPSSNPRSSLSSISISPLATSTPTTLTSPLTSLSTGLITQTTKGIDVDGVSSTSTYPTTVSPSMIPLVVPSSVSPTSSTTSQSGFSSTSGLNTVNTAQPWMSSNVPNSLGHTESHNLSSGETAGIALGAALLLTLVMALAAFLLRSRINNLPRTPLRFIRPRKHGWSYSDRLPNAEQVNTQFNWPAGRENVSHSWLGWDYRDTFAPPTLVQRVRQSLTRSFLGLQRVTHASMAPTPPTTTVRSPSRNSLTAFLQPSVTSIHPRASQACLNSDEIRSHRIGQSSTPLPPNTPRYSIFPFIQHQESNSTSQLTNLNRSNSFLLSLTLPSPTLKLPWLNRLSHSTHSSTEKRELAFKSARSWVRFHLPLRLQKSGAVTRDDEKSLMPEHPPIPPSGWLRSKCV